MRTSFESIPETLFEAAKLDGAGEFATLFRVALPVSKAIIAVMILFYAVEQWNSWFPAFIYLKDRGLWPLQLVLREIVISNNLSDMLTGIDSAELVSVSESIKYATIVVAHPYTLHLPFLQKYFVKGVMIVPSKDKYLLDMLGAATFSKTVASLFAAFLICGYLTQPWKGISINPLLFPKNRHLYRQFLHLLLLF